VTAPARSREFVLRMLALWNTHDVEAILRDLPDDLEWQVTSGPDPSGATYRGRGELRRGLEHLFGRIAELRYELVDIHAGEGHLVVELLVAGRDPKTDESLEFQACDILIFDGDRPKQKRSYRKVVAPAPAATGTPS
jgi:ketosteroid isomerase-like protein